MSVPDPVGNYARAVVAGKRPAARWHRLACERHLRDRVAKVWFFDQSLALWAIEFFTYLRHFKGEWAGQPVTLEPWQQFITGSLFGWVDPATHRRRFRVAYVEVPRANGKSTLVAGWALLLTAFDDEPASEVYCCATKRDQARIVLDTARGLAVGGGLKSHLTISRHAVIHGPSASRLEAVSSDAQKLDGLRPHAVIIDELHAHQTSDVVDVMHSALGGRRQPLIAEITTAGVSRESICFEHRTYSENVLSGALEDPSWFGFMTGIDEGDDWRDPTAWEKANPNYGVSVRFEDLDRQARQCAGMPARQFAFRTKRLNEWLSTTSQFVDRVLWDKQGGGPVPDEWFDGRECFGGLDLSSVSDLTAWCLVFPTDVPDEVVCRWRLWVPETALAGRFGVHYRAWAQSGHLTLIPGPVIDYGLVKRDILEDAARYRVIDVNIDRLFQAQQLSNELSDHGLRIFGFGMGFLSMAPVMRRFEHLLLAEKVRHGNHPVLRWMVDNLIVKRDPAGNMKPDRASSNVKIDGIIALLMALDRAARHQRASAYADHGLLVV